ncbi:aminotransferase class V-fold PLP-dependent enzyme [Actinotalea sp. BY-33]|uniref:Aminotransferase class V-fold PLP-dependent enzyme n=1 Tax=Actinotalea soli TaxID=2819234 RepID=A0A939RSR0_9CELL|nr:aminotransferase class V-fold PLP-dependent enzyme [Actinotalea soli]MBO1752182.1 aminotransferase class V-fold PLP-dependent enzyme [Actinotalea soli]
MRTAFGATFDHPEGYLNTATYGLPPRFVTEALAEVMGTWAAGTLRPAELDASVAAARQAFADLVGAPVGSVAMAGSVSTLVGLVAAAVPDGARVATLPGEFTSVTFPFAAQQTRGVSLTELPPAALVERAGEFDVVAVSLVQSADGAVLDAPALRRAVEGAAADRAALGRARTVVLLDVTQALGWADVDLGWADVVVGGSYKWLLAPRGAAWMAVRPELEERLVPHAANWYAGQDPWQTVYGLPLRLARGARRLDASPAWFTVLGAGLSMPWIAGLDRAAVQAHTVGLAARVREHLGLAPVPSPIVAIPAPDAAARLEEAGIAASVRAGAARVGFHLYSTEEDLDRLLTALG